MPTCRRLSRVAWLTACSALAVACGAGGGPKLQQTDAAQLVSLAHRIANEGACAQARDIPRLHTRAIALVNAKRVPDELQEPLMSAVNALAAQAPLCLPTVPASSPSPPPAKPKPGPKPKHHAAQARPRPRSRLMGAYRMDYELGRGGMAVVYAGCQDELDRPVALKVLAEHLAGNEEFRERFLREARIAARLHHPNLVRTYDITELDGLSVHRHGARAGRDARGRPLTRAQAADVADALAYAHGRGVVHRDLKPANLLRAADGSVKIADFGIARAAEEALLTQTGTVLGTIRYLAPEQAEGRRVGPEADVFSLGVVLQELLDDPDPAAAVERCLRRDPRERPRAAEVAAALARLDPRCRVPQTGTWSPGWRRAPRSSSRQPPRSCCWRGTTRSRPRSRRCRTRRRPHSRRGTSRPGCGAYSR